MDEKDRLGQFFDKKERAEENRFLPSATAN